MYEQKLWQDHVTEFEDRYTESRNDDGTITHTPVEGEIIQQGTPQNATNFNHMENGISNATETAALMALSTIHHQQTIAACKKQHRRHDNACEQVPLFSCHSVFSFRCSIKRVTLFLSIDEKHRLPCGSRCPAFHYALTVTSGSICLISAFASARTASN